MRLRPNKFARFMDHFLLWPRTVPNTSKNDKTRLAADRRVLTARQDIVNSDRRPKCESC